MMIFFSLSDYVIPSPIEDWDVSEMTDMSYLFHMKDTCNPNIGNWDVSGVTTFVSSIATTNVSIIYSYIYIYILVDNGQFSHILISLYRGLCLMVEKHSTRTLVAGMYPTVLTL